MKFYLFSIFIVVYTMQIESQSKVENNANLIADIKKWIRRPYVIILCDENYDSMKETLFIFKLLRLLFKKKIQASTMKLAELHLLSLSNAKRINRPMIILYLSTIKSVKTFELHSRKMDMKWSIWLVIFIEGMGKPLIDYCQNPPGNPFNLELDSRMLIKCYEDENIREWYSIYENQTEVHDLVSWDPNNRLVIENKKKIYERRFHIGGKSLKTSILKRTKIDRFKREGFLKEVLHELGTIMNFTTTIVSEEDHYGTYKNGNWSGIMSKLYSGEIDLAGAEMTMTENRLHYADFTLPIIVTYKSLYFRKPNATKIPLFGHFEAFQRNVWVSLFLFLLIIPICLTYITFRIRKFSVLFYIFSDNFLNVWRIYCQQGIMEFPKRGSLRIIYFVTFMSSSILLSAYSASLISHLTVALPKLPFYTVNEFYEQDSYKMAVIRQGETFDFIQKEENWYGERMRSLLIPESNLPKTFLEGFYMVCDKERVVLYVDETAEGVINYLEPCALIRIRTQIRIGLSISLAKNSPYTGVFNHHLRRFKEYGILNRITRRNFRKPHEIPSSDPESIAFQGIQPVLIIFMSGFLLAILILVIEKIHFYYNQKKRRAKKFDKLVFHVAKIPKF